MTMFFGTKQLFPHTKQLLQQTQHVPHVPHLHLHMMRVSVQWCEAKVCLHIPGYGYLVVMVTWLSWLTGCYGYLVVMGLTSSYHK